MNTDIENDDKVSELSILGRWKLNIVWECEPDFCKVYSLIDR